MSFNYENQKRRDLWSAIYVLKDGIVKMRERNKLEIELRITMDEELKLLHEKQELENIRRESLKKYVLLKDRLKTVSDSLSKQQQPKQ